MTVKMRVRRYASRMIRLLHPRLRRLTPTNQEPQFDAMISERILTRYRKTFEILGRS